MNENHKSEFFLKDFFPLFITIIYFFFPVNLYIIGKEQGFGIQTVFYRYNITTMGDSLITWIRDIQFICNGTIEGKSFFTNLLWGIGVIISIMGLVFLLTSYHEMGNRNRCYSVYLLLLGIFFFFMSIVNQYGIFLSSSSGSAFPIGFPLFCIVILFFWKSTD